jgi:hypothetical protein
MFRSALRPLLALGFLPLVHGAASPVPPVSFNRDIRPIMSDTCFHCHGFDAKSREAGMRLDLREEALKPTKSGLIPIVPGKPAESEIILRITDDSDPMPPESAHKKLTPAQKELFRRWVAEGARYEPHWAYAPLTRPAVPAVSAIENRESKSENSQNPIDAFIRAKLAEKKIAPSPPADTTRLLRRLSLDLTGLPPTSAELDAFNDESIRNPESALRNHTERLLASPRHGERLAVWWLDLARFSDTVGFHGDQNQRIFPYRDYVINAFNANKRFDQFTLEQLAGDLLPNPTTEQRVATGYNRLNMMTREGGAQPKEYLAKYGAERVRSVSAAWFGSTFGCAECHDHKFDPIKTRDFYELQSFFADTKQWGVYSDYDYTRNPELKGFTNDHPFPPEIEVESPYLVDRHKRLQTELATQTAALRQRVTEPAAAARYAAWIAEQRAYLGRVPRGWEPIQATAAELRKSDKPLADRTVAVAADGTVNTDKPLAFQESIRLTLRPDAGRVTAIRAELAMTPPDSGYDDTKWKWPRAAFSISVSAQSAAGVSRKVAVVFADATAKLPRFAHGAEAHGIAAGWRLPVVTKAETLTGIWLLAEPLALAPDESLGLTITGEELPPLRLSTTRLGARDPLEVAAPATLVALANASRTADEEARLLETWRMSTTDDAKGFANYHQLAAKLRETRGGKAWSMVTEAVAPLTVRVLPRGNWQDESGPVVTPATPSFLPGRLTSTPEKRLTRLDLARWLTSGDNPITARAVTNRLWAMYFGTALSAAVDDLGSQGELPSHPELLDWLASEFRDSGWDVRHLIRLIVTSATYRQGSTYRPELRESDPANRLLAAQNPRRLEAEFVRDNALFIAGALDLRDIGGPSAKPYQPAGYYAAIQFPDRDYIASDADAQWRRGVYTHWQRTFLHPMLANFDAPARDECTAQRSVSNTPQQALTLLNDPTFVESARLFAARIVAGGGSDDAARLRLAFQTALARAPKPAELTSFTAFLAAQRATYRAAPADAEKLLRIGLSPPTTGDTVELAAWTSLARVLLNSQEVITRY